jgi:hypothetical protein
MAAGEDKAEPLIAGAEQSLSGHHAGYIPTHKTDLHRTTLKPCVFIAGRASDQAVHGCQAPIISGATTVSDALR